MPEFDINTLTHPHYTRKIEDWTKWRLTYEGGQAFMQAYLYKFTDSEDDNEFRERVKISHCPAFAKAAVNEVRNSIYQRMNDISRKGGSKVYQDCTEGLTNGVDLLGANMNYFMGMHVLPELLVMGRVGIYIDMQMRSGETIFENQGLRPYLYIYKAEDIRSWDLDDTPTPNQFRSVLLRDYVYAFDETTKLPAEEVPRYRLYWMDQGTVYVRFFNNSSTLIDPTTGEETDDEPYALNLTQIPFIMLELNDSLLTDIADYQISVMNLSSADMSYCFRANFPFYTEQFDPRFDSPHLKRANFDDDGQQVDLPATAETIQTGPISGRKYPKGTDRPGFIHPSSEPMKASMAKQTQLKEEIRLLVNLAITNLQPKMASAESKGFDERTLESGLSYVGLMLENGENRIAEIWRQYEKQKEPPKITYPRNYNLRSDEDRRKEASELQKLMASVPSITYQKEIAKRIVYILLGDRIEPGQLEEIYTEIDKAEIVNVIPEIILQAVTSGILDRKSAAKCLGYPEDAADKAQQEQADRLKLIQESQRSGNGNGNSLANPASRGIPDLSSNPKQDAANEKEASRDTTFDANPEDKTRGKGK